MNLPFLAECVWRFSVVEGDSNSFPPIFPPKSKPLIGATRKFLLFTIASPTANQSESLIFGEKLEERNCHHPLPH